MWSSPTTAISPPPPKSQSPSQNDRIGNSPSKPPSVTPSNTFVNETRESLPSPGSIKTESSSKPAPKTEVKDPLGSNGGSDNDVSSPVEDSSRQAQLLQELSNKIINMGELQRLASLCIPDGAGIRSTVWKLLLGYLPRDKGQWSSELAKKRSQYKNFKDDLLKNPIFNSKRKRVLKRMWCSSSTPPLTTTSTCCTVDDRHRLLSSLLCYTLYQRLLGFWLLIASGMGRLNRY